jgi:hypothetical protein
MRQDETARLHDRARRFGYSVFHGWLELLTAMPVLIIAVGLVTEGRYSSWGWFAGLAAYTVWSGLIASVRYLRWTGVLLLSNAAAIVGWAWLLHGISAAGLLSAVAGIVLAARATGLVRFGGQARMPPFMLWGGLAACAPVAFVVHRTEELAAYGDGLAVIGGCLFAAALFLSNGAALTGATYEGRHVSASVTRMRRFNRRLVLAFGLPVLAVSFWGLIDDLIRRAAKAVLGVLAGLLPEGKEAPPVQPSPSPPSAKQEPFPMKPEGEPAWIWVVLEWLLMAALAAAVLLAAFLLLRQIVRRMPAWLRAVGAWLAKYRSGQLEEETGYVDEVSSTRDGSRTEAPGPWTRLKRLFRTEHTVRWEELRSNRERVRYLYALAVRKSAKAGFQWKPQWTPAETAAEAARMPPDARKLDPGLCEVYERARYGIQETDDADIARWKKRVEE